MESIMVKKSNLNSKKAVLERTNDEIRHGRHCVFLMHTHLVFVTKYRRVVFTKRVLEHLESVLKEVCEKMNAELVEFNGEGDHVHLLINYPPTLPVSKLVNALKGVSSRKIREENYPEIKTKLWKNQLWSPSYFAGSCGGAKLDVIKKYIENQERPD
jgi:putative transposase